MSIKSRADLKAFVDAYIETNGLDAITGEILNQFLNDLSDSAINKNGDTGILGVLSYNSLYLLTNDGDLVYKKYLIDTITSIVPKKVTDSITIALLANSSNWGATNQYTGTTITGQNTGDWYDDGSFRYLFVTNTAVSRIPYALL